MAGNKEGYPGRGGRKEVEPREVRERVFPLLKQVQRVILGKPKVVELATVGLLAGGHILIEDIPGVGKTMLAKAIAKSIGGTFRRIQFTPDLLPSDVTGVSVFNPSTKEFRFKPGPIFANVVLADEINRASPKTQSALLECMEEFQVTVDGVTHPLPRPFFVIATENPIESHGSVYPLPESQLDRFLLRLRIGYPALADEVDILESQQVRHPIEDIKPVLSAEEVLGLQRAVREVYVDRAVKTYIVQIADATRRHEAVRLGASPRASIALMRCSQALAALRGREFVTPDEVKLLAPYVLSHRLILRTGSRERAEEVVAECLSRVPVPVVRV
ncbi:MAG TPA: MoxR family ATPase [Armatimonadetes bacterium]|nr:MoxR family ATPase [Armatimonadota bacterium]